MSGYWSQEGTVQVMSLSDEPNHIWVRWPGGKVVSADLPRGAKEIAMDPEGILPQESSCAFEASS